MECGNKTRAGLRFCNRDFGLRIKCHSGQRKVEEHVITMAQEPRAKLLSATRIIKGHGYDMGHTKPVEVSMHHCTPIMQNISLYIKQLRRSFLSQMISKNTSLKPTRNKRPTVSSQVSNVQHLSCIIMRSLPDNFPHPVLQQPPFPLSANKTIGDSGFFFKYGFPLSTDCLFTVPCEVLAVQLMRLACPSAGVRNASSQAAIGGGYGEDSGLSNSTEAFLADLLLQVELSP
jgi:hypothetical protein